LWALEVTTRCNFKCVHCTNTFAKEAPADLSLELFQRVVPLVRTAHELSLFWGWRGVTQHFPSFGYDSAPASINNSGVMGGSITTFDGPHDGRGTFPTGINAAGAIAGDVTGWFADKSRQVQGFVRADAVSWSMIRHEAVRALPLIGLALLLAACKPPEQPAITSMVGAVLLDGTGGPPISNSVVTIENGWIRAAGARTSLLIPPEAEKIDGAGKFLAPVPIDVARLSARAGAVIVRPGDPESSYEEARRDHKPILGQISTLRDARAMVARGVTGCLHMIRDTEAIDPAFIAQMRDLRIVVVPMLAAERDPRALGVAKRNTKKLADGGVLLAVGSGGDIYPEMEALAEAGIPPADVLVAATRNGALALGMGDAGTIEAGKRADMLLLSANPAEDVRNFGRVVRTMREGRWQ